MSHDLHLLLRGWQWLLELDSFHLIDVSPFGELLLQDVTGAYCLLDINFGLLEYVSEAGDDPASLFPIAFDGSLADDCKQGGLSLSEGTCYGYKNPLVTGAPLTRDNVYVAVLQDYLDFMGDFHNSIKDVADGESVVIKVVRNPVQ